MATQSVPPLRIQKGSAASSPNKMTVAANRPLTELSPMAIRRNSPSFPQGKANLLKNDSSPAGSSPFSLSGTNSPRMFWHGRDQNSPAREIRSTFEPIPSPAPAKRSSIENLKRASRVKNSSMFALEQTKNYDPTRPTILDGAPVSSSRSSGMLSPSPTRTENIPPTQTSPSKAVPATVDDEYFISDAVAPLSPSKQNISPTKSSLSKRSGAAFRHSAFDPDTGIWEDEDDEEKKLPEGKRLHRYAKSVTFDKAPPQVNEYEMTTPDPSSVTSGSREGSHDSMEDEEEDISFEGDFSVDNDDSFDASLEDTDKTPVVLPEDWRFMSPDTANTELASHEEDVFDDEYGSPAPTANPGLLQYRDHQISVNSVDSNGQPRPLPPLPSAIEAPQKTSPVRDTLSGTLERMSNAQRNLPSPPTAPAVSKTDIRRMSGGILTMDDRLRLMMAEKEQQQKTETDAQRERRMRRAGSKDTSPVRSLSHDTESDVLGEPGPEVLEEQTSVHHISRESIMRHMRSQQDLYHAAGSEDSSGTSRMSFDPDVPIPSMEDPTQQLSLHEQVTIKQEEVEDNGLYAIPDLYAQRPGFEYDTEDDLGSQYSQPSMLSIPSVADEDGQETPRANSPAREQATKEIPHERMSLPDFVNFGEDRSFDFGLETYMTPPSEPQAESEKACTSYPETEKALPNLPDLAALRSSIQRPYTPQEQLQAPPAVWESDEPGTPESVIRHPTSESVLSRDEVPVSEATIRAPGSKLKTRPSLTKSDTELMPPDEPSFDEERKSISSSIQSERLETKTEVTSRPAQEPQTADKRQIRVSSLKQLEIPEEQVDEGLSFGLEKEFDRVVEAQKVEFERSLRHLYYPFSGRFPSSEVPDPKDLHMMSNVPVLPKPLGARPYPNCQAPHLGESLANRSVLHQRGYLMRQNTKVVVATERPSHEEPRAGNALPPYRDPADLHEANEVHASPRKASQPTWTAEPWNGRTRRKSIRVGGETSPIKRKALEGPAPPLPGQMSNVKEALGQVAEDDLAEEEAEDVEDGAERGRLFVKVIGVKDLQLPFPKNERTQFALTLDNGLHCVTTAWLDLAKNAPIGQEFELVVLNDLEFQLTLQMKLEEPKVQRPASPTKTLVSPTKGGVFGRLFGSPKKRKEEARMSQPQTRPVTPPSAYELVQGLVAKDGSFARAYVNLTEHEKAAYGRPYSVDIKCFNEWAMEEVNVGSSRSKKSAMQLQRRPPYQIGNLELLLLYVPKPKSAKDEDMPKSMNGAVRAMREAEERSQEQASVKEFQGHLSQQGGDCPYWRRRFFKLVGTKLTAYHEATHQPRATINLAKATKLIDDNSALAQKETTTRGGGRRKSAFAEEEEGYMFIEEGFRVRFANGEVIDFYADSTPHKEEWMVALSQIVGKGIPSTAPTSSGKAWTEMVLKREKAIQTKERKTQPKVPARTGSRDIAPLPSSPIKPQSPVKSSHSPTKLTVGNSGIPLPSRPAPAPASRPSAGHQRTESYQPDMGSRSTVKSPVKSRVSQNERHRKTKSMLM